MKRVHGGMAAKFGVIAALSVIGVGAVVASIINLTQNDFHLSGTQMGSVNAGMFYPSSDCRGCHGDFDPNCEPYANWAGSLMAQAGRDPLFFAQMSTANQDVANVGTFCMRCHVPMSYVTGHAVPPDGSALDAQDKDGVTCHFCHSMVDPIWRPNNPQQDLAILASMGQTPQNYGNAQFVLDPTGLRRGPLLDATPPHEFVYSQFHLSGNLCGTCHEVGNVAVTRQPNGTYRYNSVDAPTPDENPATQFPLERTYSEWKLSAFANGGVDMGGRFGGGVPVVSTCQDCHMPKVAGRVCFYGPIRQKVPRHEFAGAAAQVMDLISAYTGNDPDVDQDLLAEGQVHSISMLQRAASLNLSYSDSNLGVRVINESGHKLPTGHIEGRRVWINVQFFDATGTLVAERGAYDTATAEFDESSTTVYEMVVGLSPDAAALTGFPAGPTGHMSLADTIVSDNRIPPRGFNNAAYEAAGAPAVGAPYADGQYWDDRSFAVPAGAVRADVAIYYQSTPKHYIEMLRDNNHTDNWGTTLYNLWSGTGRGTPIRMAIASIAVNGPCNGDFNGDGDTGTDADIEAFFACVAGNCCPTCASADFNGDGDAATDADIESFFRVFAGGSC
jgi:hypothetical protein